MNGNELAAYYSERASEFFGEEGANLLVQKLKKYVTPSIEDKTLAIDVGSCVGDYIENILDICGTSRQRATNQRVVSLSGQSLLANLPILCFEPNPVNVKEWKKNINISNVKLYECCLSDRNCKAKLYSPATESGSSNPTGNACAGLHGCGTEICDTETYRLDYIVDKDFNGYAIKFIKIDTEGHDYSVLLGMGNLLNKTEYIIFECSDCLDDFRGPNIENPMKTLVDYLDSYNFDVYRIGTKKLFRVNGEYWNDTYEKTKFWSNCFALKKSNNIITNIIDMKTFDYVDDGSQFAISGSWRRWSE